MEEIMSNEKNLVSTTKNPPVVRSRGKVADTAKVARDVQIVSLEIVDDEHGGDPYNRTGSHCIIKLD